MWPNIPTLAVIISLGSVLALASAFDTRIVGGSDASWNSVPWTASIRYLPSDGNFGYGHFCGGSLINNRTILTAAHCLYDSNDRLWSASNLRVVGGNLNRFWSNSSTYIGRVSRIVAHKNYNSNTYANDIGLLILQDAVPSNHQFFKTINLATSAFPTNTSCIISGWGDLAFNGYAATNLQKADVLVYNRTMCQTAYGALPAGSLCAGLYGGGVDSCQGDSGGPLVCNGVLAGVVSSGFECARPGYPGIYTDVTHFADWIRANDSPSLRALGWMTLLISAAVVRLLGR